MPDLNEQSQSDRRRICWRTLVEDRVAQYFIERQDWSSPQRNVEYWQEKLPGSCTQHITNVLNRSSDEGSVVKVLVREMPDELRVRPFGERPISLAGESISSAVIHGPKPEYQVGKAAVAHYLPSPQLLDRLRLERQGYPPYVLEAADQELRRLVRALHDENIRCKVAKTNIPNDKKVAIEELANKIAKEFKSPLRQENAKFRTIVLGIIRDRVVVFPVASEVEKTIRALALAEFERVNTRAVTSQFRALSAPHWPNFRV